MSLRSGRKLPAKVKSKSEEGHVPEQEPSLALGLKEQVAQVRQALKFCDDLVCRPCRVCSRPAMLVYIDGLTQKEMLEEHVLRPLAGARDCPGVPPTGELLSALLTAHQVQKTSSLKDALAGLLGGEALLLTGDRVVWLIEAKGFPRRGVEDAKSEMVIRGARESFTETIMDNVALVRRYLPDPRLKVRFLEVGSRTHTRVAVLYLEDLAAPELVAEILRRLEAACLEGVLESSYLAEMTSDHFWTPFPLVQHTERPDKTAGVLLEGRVILLTDRSPNALILPSVFFDFFQTAEDYYYPVAIAAFFRWLRLGASVSSMFLTGLYIALMGVNPELLPVDLALSISGTRHGVPFSGWTELLLLDLAMEVFREASVRLPGALGSAVGIVGGMVLGTAAVEAGLVSNIVVIVVGATAITSFAAPSYPMAAAFRLCRYFVLLLASFFGLFGLLLAFALLQLHLVRLQSFGVPYFTPLGPFIPRDLGDILARKPLVLDSRRPSFVVLRHPRRLWREADEYE